MCSLPSWLAEEHWARCEGRAVYGRWPVTGGGTLSTVGCKNDSWPKYLVRKDLQHWEWWETWQEIAMYSKCSHNQHHEPRRFSLFAQVLVVVKDTKSINDTLTISLKDWSIDHIAPGAEGCQQAQHTRSTRVLWGFFTMTYSPANASRVWWLDLPYHRWGAFPAHGGSSRQVPPADGCLGGILLEGYQEG